MTLQFSTPVSIDDHGLLIVKGPDAYQFLQGQVTCDLLELILKDDSSKTCLGAHCTPKGRMLFSFRAFEIADNTIALSIYRPLLDDALATLKKYSVFSKVELLIDDQHTLIGLRHDHVSVIAEWLPHPPEVIGSATRLNGNIMIKLNDEFFECWVTKKTLAHIKMAENPYSGNDYWAAIMVGLGVAEVRTETVEAWIPQMLNLQSVGDGISFTKGCYTGQEVIARMHYLGKSKKRLYRFKNPSTKTLNPGDPLYTPDNQQTIGQVVLTSKVNRDLLAVTTDTALEQDQVYSDQEYSHKLQALSLPYAITKGVE